MSAPSTELRVRTRDFIDNLQREICAALEAADGTGKFRMDKWTHDDGGGGTTCVLEGNGLIERCGVNTSAVTVLMSDAMASRLGIERGKIYATGISVVLHPFSPMVPTIHMNLRYLEPDSGEGWFGGGIDLTPWYCFDEDARHFHASLKSVCDRHPCASYALFKKWCDEYFYLPHRRETRGVGGIFFDDLKGDSETNFAFIREIGETFLKAYLPIVERRKGETWGGPEREWQLMRRGRYVEFNLLYDRGTQFGFESGGRVESILMSLPPNVKWAYDRQPFPNSKEAALLEVLRHPRAWV